MSRAVIVISLALAACQSSFVYFPTRGLEGTPADSGLDYDDVHLTAADGVRIHAWYVHTEEPTPEAVILLCHGNGGNLYNWVGLAEMFAQLGFDVLLFDYRGYGDSEGSPDEEGTYLDADAAWSHLVSERKIPAERIVIYGRSLGGAVASHLAVAHTPGALIVDSSFTTIREFAMENYPRLLVRLGLTYGYNNTLNVRKVRAPVLVIHGRDDELVPFRHGEAIFAAASEPKRFLALDGGHNDNYIVDAAKFRQGIADFVAAHVRPTVVAAAKEPELAPVPAPQSTPAPAPMSFDEAWEWVRAELPGETANLAPLEGTDGLLERLLAWAEPDETFAVFDRSCRKLQLTRNEASLDGPIHVKTVVRGKTKTVSGDSIGFDCYITVVCSFENEYERTAAGWVETGTSATGCADTVGHRLSKVTGTAAWYGGATVTISLKCIHTREEEQRCLDGSTRVCATCERIGMETDSHDGHSFRSAVGSATVHLPPGPTPTDCAVPCPKDERGDELPRANAVLEKVELLRTDLEEHPTLFRTRAACQAYAKRHKMTADDRAQW